MNQSKVVSALAAMAVFGVTAMLGYAATTGAEKKASTQRSSESTVSTNDNGSVSRMFTEMTVSTNGNLVTEHRRETRTTIDAEGNILATTTSEYAQTYPVGEDGISGLSKRLGDGAGETEAANDSFMGLKFGETFGDDETKFEADQCEPTLLRTTFIPKKALVGFDDYYVYVTPKTKKVVKVCACAKEAIDPGTNWRRHYLIEALEKKYRTWARPRSWCRPVYTFDIGSGRYVTACLAGSSRDYETVLVGWDDALLTTAADETEEIRQDAIKAAVEKRRIRVSDAADAF